MSVSSVSRIVVYFTLLTGVTLVTVLTLLTLNYIYSIGDNKVSKLWIVEYSELADRKNSYPWHIEPEGRIHPNNKWSNSWKILFVGNQQEALEKLEELVKEWREDRAIRKLKESRR